MHRIIFVFLINLMLTACMNTTTYQYADGSSNVYILKPDSLEYIPVRPEESSTGFYSGGDPKKTVLSPEEFRHVSTLLEAARRKLEIHVSDRIKNSGQITTLSGTKKTRFVIKPGCKEMTEIETELKRLLK